MNQLQEDEIRVLADDGKLAGARAPMQLIALAQVVLELVAIAKPPTIIVPGNLPPEDVAAMIEAARARGPVLVKRTEHRVESPITVEELKRRGCDDELEARALDVVLRLGWPRPGDRMGLMPCIPVPVDVLKRMQDTVATIGGVSGVAKRRLSLTIDALLEEQERLVGIYAEVLPEHPLPEPATNTG